MKMLYLSESLYKENPLQVNRCRGDQILYGISVAVVMEAPFHDFIKNGLKIVSFFRERVLYMGRDFIDLFPFDEPVRFQLAESLRKGCIRDYFEHPFQKSESCRIVDTEFIKDLGFPLSLQHQEERSGVTGQWPRSVTIPFFTLTRYSSYVMYSIGILLYAAGTCIFCT